MRTFSPGSRGRKKNVRKFRSHDGLWIIAIVLVGMIISMALWELGVFRLDAD